MGTFFHFELTVWCLDFPIRVIESGNFFAIDCFNTQGSSIGSTSVFGQAFCEIVIPSLSNKPRPKMGRKPSATTVFFLLLEFSDHYLLMEF